MAIGKGFSTPLASTANAAGATTTSATVDLTGDYDAVLTGSMTNGGTGPTLPCVATCQVSGDGTNWDTYLSCTASIGAGIVTPFRFDLKLAVGKARVQFTGNTGQSVTCVCREQHDSGI